MSAFIVEDKTIHKIVSYLVDGTKHWLTNKQKSELGLEILQMNCKAVNQRYAEEAPNETIITKYTYIYTKATLPEVLKAFDCLLYQCSEGTVPKMRLFKKLKKYRQELIERIVRDSDEYKNAEWM